MKDLNIADSMISDMGKPEKARCGSDDFLDIPLLTRIANAVIKEDRKLLEELAKH